MTFSPKVVIIVLCFFVLILYAKKGDESTVSAKTILTKTILALLALTAVFSLVLYASWTKGEVTAENENYEVTTQRDIQTDTQIITVNINTANAEELEKLPGIGEVKAAAIVAYRQSNGPFTCPEELLKVPGIGQKILEAIRENIIWEIAP